jgi:hypothetical protein
MEEPNSIKATKVLLQTKEMNIALGIAFFYTKNAAFA